MPLECATGEEASCPPPMCASDDACPPAAACADPRCLEGVCVYAADDARCAAGERCDPERGCFGVPDPPDAGSDAGSDGGSAADAGSGDAGGSDAGPGDAGAPDAGLPAGPLQLGSPFQDVGLAIAASADGDLYVAGSTFGSTWDGSHMGNGDAVVLRLSPDGALRWARRLGTGAMEEARGVALGPGGAVYVTGTTAGDLAGSTRGGSDLFVAAYDPDGTRRWLAQDGTAGDEIAHALAVDAAGVAYVVGETTGSLDGTPAGPYDYFVMRFEATGTRTWARQDGTDQPERARAVAIDPASGDVVVVGETSGALAGPTGGNQDVLVMRYTASGGRTWMRQRGSLGSDIGHGVALLGGAIYVGGSTTAPLDGETLAGATDALLQRWDLDGTWRWTRLVGTATSDTVTAVCAASAGPAVFPVGAVSADLHGEVGAGSNDLAALRFDAAGARQWTRLIGTADPDSARACAWDPGRGFLYVLGNTSGVLGPVGFGGIDLAIVRFDAAGVASPR